MEFTRPWTLTLGFAQNTQTSIVGSNSAWAEANIWNPPNLSPKQLVVQCAICWHAMYVRELANKAEQAKDLEKAKEDFKASKQWNPHPIQPIGFHY